MGKKTLRERNMRCWIIFKCILAIGKKHNPHVLCQRLFTRSPSNRAKRYYLPPVCFNNLRHSGACSPKLEGRASPYPPRSHCADVLAKKGASCITPLAVLREPSS
ncbi:hypothetical protein SESBI_43821 [Sesbania bispinosa]|nr:hypothetical protein SESBI_43821 [Sesbania bispinosa]